MKKKLVSLCLALALCLSLTVPALAVSQEEQQIVVNGEVYFTLLKALMSEEENKPITAFLETDVQLTNDAAIVLGSSDYGGMFGGMVFTVNSHDITIDLNGHTLTSNPGCPAFEVQSGYTLTIVDTSTAKTGKLVSDTNNPVDVKEGGTYNPLPAAETSDESEDTVASEKPFSDVAESSPFYQAILWAVDQGITAGYTDGTFGPSKTCTRAHIITFLWRAAGGPEPKAAEPCYEDVTDTSAYYYKAVQWAAEMGMEDSDTFRPGDVCTRFDAVYFIWRANGSPEAKGTVSFEDMVKKEGEEFLHPIECVYWAVEAGVTTGYEDNTFHPDNACTRGHIAAFLYRAAH